MSELERLSFCPFRLPKEGGRVIWEVTNRCNYQCSYCIFSCNNKPIEGELSTDDFFRAMSQLKMADFTYLKFTGGEPFYRRDMMLILREANRLGFDMDISTNASMITRSNAAELAGYGLEMVHVSCDGPKEIHESIRGKNSFKPTVRGVGYLVENGIYVRLGTVIFKGNEHRLEETVQSAANLGVSEIIFSYLGPVGRAKEHPELMAERTVPDIRDEVERLGLQYAAQVKVSHSLSEAPAAASGGQCPGYTRFMYINNLGRISPCTWIADSTSKYDTADTLRTGALNELMSSGPVQQFFEDARCKAGCLVERR